MTESLPENTAHQNKLPEEASQHLGSTATGNALGSEVTVQDLAEVRSGRLYTEFTAFEAEERRKEQEKRNGDVGSKKDAQRIDPFAASRIIYRFILGKAVNLQSERHIHEDVQKFPEGMIIGNVQQLRHERDLNPKTSQRPAFMRDQKRAYMPIWSLYADDYPEIHFATLLRNEFQANDDFKNAALVSEILIGIGRTIVNSNKNMGHPPKETNGV